MLKKHIMFVIIGLQTSLLLFLTYLLLVQDRGAWSDARCYTEESDFRSVSVQGQTLIIKRYFCDDTNIHVRYKIKSNWFPNEILVKAMREDPPMIIIENDGAVSLSIYAIEGRSDEIRRNERIPIWDRK